MAEVERLMRNSETQTYKECRQKWKWSYVDRWQANVPRPALEIGTMVHAALQHWYIKGRKRGVHPAKTVARLYREYLQDGGQEIKVKVGSGEDDPGSYVEINELMVEMMKNYINEYGKDDIYEVIAPEQLFQVRVTHSKTGKYLFTAVGQIDLVVRDMRSNRLGFLEHKTGATLAPFGAPEPLDEQSGTYWTYGPGYLRHTGQIAEDDELEFITFNRLRKAFKDQRPTNAEGHALNKDGTVSKKQPAPLFKRSSVFRSAADANILDKRIQAVHAEMVMIRNKKLSVYKSPGRHCGYCEFRHVCEIHENGGDYKEMFKQMFTKWSPYEDHEAQMKGRE